MAPKQTAVAVQIEPQQIMLTIEQASRLLGATPWAIRRMLYAGELPYKRAVGATT